MLVAANAGHALTDLVSRHAPYIEFIEDLVHDVVFALAVEPGEQYRFVYVNPGFERATGLVAGKIVGQLIDDVIPPQSLPLVKEKYREALLSGTAMHWDEVSPYPTGMKVGEVTVRLISDDANDRQLLVGTVHDVTDRHVAQKRLAELEERWRLALEASGAAAWEWDSQSNIINFSLQWRELLGRDPAPLPANETTLQLLVHPDDVGQVVETRHAIVLGNLRRFVFELRMRHAHEQWVWVRCRGRAYPQPDGNVRVLGTLIDISATKRAEQLLWLQAHHDELTGLPNRKLFLERLRAAVHCIGHGAPPFAVLFVDLDEFKEVNDTLGHATGDRLLCQVARRIATCVPATATVARHGGDEFMVLLTTLSPIPTTDSDGIVESAADAILQALTQPFQVDGETLHISASIGIAYCPHDAKDAASLLNQADQALHEAKRCGRNRIEFFRPTMQERTQRRRRMIRDLRRAIRNGEMEVLYQPIIDLGTGRMCKAEALLRWNHPLHGRICPTEFIPLCEETGLIVEIGEWVFKTVVSNAAHWHRQGWHDLKIGLNVSPIQIRHGGDSCARCLAFLAMQRLPPGVIVAEVTEGSLLHNDPQVQEQLRHMLDHGIVLALDDFGTGYSALSYLQQYTFSYLKIDRSFVHGMQTASAKHTLCETIILMAHRLGMQVIAEGIENEHDAELLRLAGCDFGQGFQFSYPMSANELEKWGIEFSNDGCERRKLS